MLHTTYRGNRPAGSVEKIFEVFLSLKLTRTVHNHFVGQSAIHGQILTVKASVTNSPIQKVVCNS